MVIENNKKKKNNNAKRERERERERGCVSFLNEKSNKNNYNNS